MINKWIWKNVEIGLMGFVFLILFISKALAIDNTAVRMLIPLYIHPTATAYLPVVEANIYRNIDVIVNPNNGASTSKDPSYVSAIAQLRDGGVGIYGYTYTGWGTRSLSVVKADIDNWKLWYGVDGIFLDEGGNTNSVLSYYADLYAYITSKGMKVIMNPGTSTIESFMSVADSNCIYESDPARVLSSVPTWASKYNASEFCILEYAANASQMKSTVAYAKSHNVGYVFVTDATVHFWSSLPAYLAEEAAALADGLIGDYYKDGKVDLLDFGEWKKRYLAIPPTMTLADFGVWKTEYLNN